MREFIDDDEGFYQWLDTHQHGYVLNTNRSGTASYLVLHRATCGHLRRRDAREVHKTRQYIKICSTDRTDLQRWADRHSAGHAELTHCGICKP